MQQYYKIAGLTVKMNTFGRTADAALPYGIEPCEEADITITANWRYWKAAHPRATPDTCEYIATGKDFYLKLLDFDGMMLHASAVAMDGKAYLFSADSGVGKSTHAGLWQQVFGENRVLVLNDDKPALRLEDGVWYTYGTPWSGKNGINLNLRYPLAGICFLEQSERNKIERYEKNDVVFQFMKQTYRTKDIACKLKILSHIDGLLKKIPVWRLECNMEPEAALLSHQVMTGDQK